MTNPNPERDERLERVWITWDDAYPWPTSESGGDEYVRVELVNDAATRMRDRCVERLMKLRETYRAGARTANAEERNRDQLIFLHKANAITDAVNEIQSLPLEGEQEKR